MTNYLADELRQIVAALDDTPLMGQPVHRQLLALTERVQALGDEPAEHELDAIVSGLEPEQEIRARAAEIAWPNLNATTPLPQSFEVVAAIASYIRDGSRP